MDSPRDERAIAYSAVGIYAGAMLVGAVEAIVGGGEQFSNGERALVAADRALYAAKRAGRDRVAGGEPVAIPA